MRLCLEFNSYLRFAARRSSSLSSSVTSFLRFCFIVCRVHRVASLVCPHRVQSAILRRVHRCEPRVQLFLLSQSTIVCRVHRCKPRVSSILCMFICIALCVLAEYRVQLYSEYIIFVPSRSDDANTNPILHISDALLQVLAVLYKSCTLYLHPCACRVLRSTEYKYSGVQLYIVLV